MASGGLTDTSFPAGCDRAALSAVRYRYNVGRAYQGCGRPARAFVDRDDDTARAAVEGLAGRLGL
jgi:hypothetical protein